jgi:hypothetical protein
MKKITVEWANEQHDIILVTYHSDDWQWVDFTHAFEEQKALLDQSEAPIVHVIVDVIKSQLMPKGGSLISASRNLSQDAHPKQGHTIIVGARGVVGLMVDIVGRLLGPHRSKVHTVTTMDAAYNLLAEITA